MANGDHSARAQPVDRQIAESTSKQLRIWATGLGSFAARRSYGVAAGELDELLPKQRSSMPPELMNSPGPASRGGHQTMLLTAIPT
jgi:hypothetical protein